MSGRKGSHKIDPREKVTEVDGIPAEVWKLEYINDQLLEVCNRACHGDMPDMWLEGIILLFPKEGRSGQCIKLQRYHPDGRGGGAKIYNRMLLDGFRSHIDPKLKCNQNGFRKGRSTVTQILILRRLVEGNKSKNLPAISLLLISVRRLIQFTGVNNMEIIRACEVPVVIVDAVNMMHTNTSPKVLSPNGGTEFFKILAGVLQGNTLAPFLFIIALDYDMRRADGKESNLGFTLNGSRSRRHPARVICDTGFGIRYNSNVKHLEQAQLLSSRAETSAKADWTPYKQFQNGMY